MQVHVVMRLEKELGTDSTDPNYNQQDAEFKKLMVQNEELERALEKHGESPVVDYEETTQSAME
jgi:hypothetical protein